MPIREWESTLHRQLDMEYGKKILELSNRRVPVDPDAYHLIVGLGGTGCRALIETKGYIQRACREPESHVAYLAIDTDLQELRDLKSSGITGEVRLEDHERHFLDPRGVADMLAPICIENTYARHPEIFEWLDGSLNVPGDGCGANHQRQVGRLLLWNNLTEIREVIKTTICRLCAGSGKPIVFTVYLLTGVSGGTGSGTFLDMAYLLRQTMQWIGGSVAEGKIYGYFFMPDVNNHRVTTSPMQKKCNARNAYAALQELDYNLGLFKKGERFLMHYENHSILRTGLDPQGMFDHVHLVSATNSVGTVLYDATHRANVAVAQNILSFVTNADRMGPDMTGQWAGGFYGNIPNDATSAVSLGNIAHRYEGYLAIGSSQFELPVDDMMMYITKKLFDELKVLRDDAHKPDQKAGSEIRRLLSFTYANVATSAVNNVPQLMIPGNLSVAQLLNQRDDDSYFWINEAAATVTGFPLWIPKVTEQLRIMAAAFKKAFDEQLQQIFVDPKRGPIYAKRLIEDHVLVELARDKEINHRMIGIRPLSYPTGAGDYDNCKKAAMDALRILHSHPTQADADLCNATGAEFFKQCVFTSIAEVVEREYYTVIEDYVKDKQKELYSFIDNLLERLTETFASNAARLTGAQEKAAAAAIGKPVVAKGAFDWQDMDIDCLSGQLDSMFEACLKDGTGERNVETMLGDLLDKLWQDTQLWLQDPTRFDPRRFVSEFVDRKFGRIAEQSIESVVTALLAEDGAAAVPFTKSVQDTLMPMLLDAARPMYYGTIQVPTGPVYTLISVPHNCPTLLAAVKDHVDQHGELNASIVQSTLRDRIFVQTVLTGVQLAGFASVAEAEEHYAESYLSSPGVHLYHPTLPQCRGHMDWNELYTLIPRGYRGSSIAPQTMRLLEQEDRQKAVLAELFDADKGYAPRYPFARLEKTDREWTVCFSMTEADVYPLTVSVVKDPITQSADEEKTFFNLQEEYLTRYMLMKAVEAELERYRAAAQSQQ